MSTAEELCAEHPSRPVEAFCAQCEQLLCIGCILTNQHKGHDMLPLEDALAIKKQAIRTELDKHVLPANRSLKEIQEALTSAKAQMEQTYSSARQALYQQFSALHTQLEQLQTEMAKQLESEFELWQSAAVTLSQNLVF
jgi:DNA anti-recombination protein RmuC